MRPLSLALWGQQTIRRPWRPAFQVFGPPVAPGGPAAARGGANGFLAALLSLNEEQRRGDRSALCCWLPCWLPSPMTRPDRLITLTSLASGPPSAGVSHFESKTLVRLRGAVLVRCWRGARGTRQAGALCPGTTRHPSRPALETAPIYLEGPWARRAGPERQDVSGRTLLPGILSGRARLDRL